MGKVGAFIHLYHVWGLFGGVTMLLYGTQAYKNWRAAGGTWRAAPCEWFNFVCWTIRETVLDLARGVLWPFMRTWPESEWVGRSYPREQAILVGITLGGMGRLMTALYWSERNREWMSYADSWVIEMASIPVICMIFGDFLHHVTAWQKHRFIPRLLVLAGILWVTYGVFFTR